jgi:hypothetical protein
MDKQEYTDLTERVNNFQLMTYKPKHLFDQMVELQAKYTALLAVAERMEYELAFCSKILEEHKKFLAVAMAGEALEAFRKLKEPPTERE